MGRLSHSVEEAKNQVKNFQSVVGPFQAEVLPLCFFLMSGAIDQPTQLLLSALLSAFFLLLIICRQPS